MSSITQLFTCCRRPTRTDTFEEALQAKKINNLLSIIQGTSFEPNKPLPNGAFPLHLAVHSQADEQVIQALLKRGADPLQTEDNCGLTATDHALLINSPKLLSLLLQKFTTETNAQLSADQKQEIGKKILNARSSIQSAFALLKDAKPGQDNYRLTPLHLAVSSGTEKEKLIEMFSAAENITQPTCSGITIAHSATSAKNSIALQEIADRDATLFLQGSLTGLTPLHLAMLYKDFETARFLAEKAPKALTQPDDNGLTPTEILLYHVAAHAERAEAKTGPVLAKERLLLALHFIVPLLETRFTSYYIPLLLNAALLSTECYQSQEPTVATQGTGKDSAGAERLSRAIIPAIAEASFNPKGKVGLFFVGNRIKSVATNTFSQLRRAWNYARYEPLTGFKRSIVHLTGLGLSVGRTAYKWWYQ